MSKIVNVEVPDIGDFTDVDIIEVLVSAGDIIAKEDPLLTLESDKASMEIPSTLAGTVGGGLQTPGFTGHSKHYIGSSKFISAEGGLLRVGWMPKALKEEIRPMLERRGKELGVENLYDLIADEETATTEEEVMEFMTKVNHPALSLPPLF